MKCRICSNILEKPFLSLGSMPLSNSLVCNPLMPEKYYPLDIYICPKCFLVQLQEFELATNIFSSDYIYYSSYSNTWLRHCQEYVNTMLNKYKYNDESLIIEIGSNDGYLLQYFKEYNIKVLGIDPAALAAKIAIDKGIPTDISYFNMAYADEFLKSNKTKADLIIGNNVLAHNPNLHDFVEAMRMILKPDGIITLEFPYLFYLINEKQFDTIYHEHFSYFSLFSIIELFKRHNLIAFDVEELSTHGGSLRIYVGHGNNHKEKETIDKLLKKEKGLQRLDTYLEFTKNISMIKRNLLQILITLKNENKKIVGYGAPAKGNTLLNFCGIGTDFIDYTVDLNTRKQDLYMAGSHVPIKSPNIIKDDEPDYILIFPWNIKDEIMTQLRYIKEWNGKFIVPIPEPKIINPLL